MGLDGFRLQNYIWPMRKPDAEKTREYRERQKAEGWVRLEMYVPRHLRDLIRAVVAAVVEAMERKGDES